MTAQLRKRVLWQWRAFRRAQIFKPFGRLAHGRAQIPNAEPDKYRLDLVDNPRLLSDQILALAVRSPRVLLLDRTDRHHAAIALLAAQPAEKDAPQKFRIETIGLGAPVFARHRDAGRMDDVGLNIARPQPARQPEAVAASLKGDDDTLDVAPSLAGFAAPTMQKLQQHFLVGIELLKRLAFDAGNERRNQPLRLAHLDHGDDCAILLESGEGPARVKTRMLRHRGAPSVVVEQRPWCHAFAARPIASSHFRTRAAQQTRSFTRSPRRRGRESTPSCRIREMMRCV